MSVDPNWNWSSTSIPFTNCSSTSSTQTWNVTIPIEVDPNIHVRSKNGKPTIRFNAGGLKEGQYYEAKWKKRKWLLCKKGKHIDLYEFVSKEIPTVKKKK